METLNINNPVELNIPRYYFDSVNGYVFRIDELITCAGGHLITNMSGVGTLSCNTLCPQPTTTTLSPTTTTLSPTTTTLSPTTTTLSPTTTTLSPTTTTLSPTTTTTTVAPPSYEWYTAERYLCDPCTATGSSVYVRSSSSLTVGNYYNIADGYVYQLSGLTTEQITFINFDGAIAKSGTDCTDVCQL